MERVPRRPRREEKRVWTPDDAPELLDELLKEAMLRRSSDIHVEPKEDRLRVRFRVDGVMVDDDPLPPEIAPNLVSRVKILAQMDIAERRLPQDGTFSFQTGNGETVSVRASTFPSVYGEKAVLRLLLGGAVIPLEALGMTVNQVKAMRGFCRSTGGLVVVTGPTGSGKTTTLYTMLSEVDTEHRNVVTLEDPIEVRLRGITQGQVLPRAGFTFAKGLRSILRQDPDVILVGEMRDQETAEIAVQASLTGHLVLSTLHTNSTVDTITRLVDIGLEGYIVANALIGVVAQRLLRRACERCARPWQPDRDLGEELGFPLPPGGGFVEAPGCVACLETGYRGRLGIYEVVTLDDRLRELVKTKQDSRALKLHLREQRVATLRRMGVGLAMKGVTTIEEVMRVT